MFGKLIKNEFRGTWQFMVTIFAAFALLTVFGGVSVRILNSASDPSLLPVLTIILYVISIFVVFFGILIYLGNRYYKTMYSTQGYLTHTLPASENSIFSAKVLTSVIWMMAGIILMVSSIYAMGDIGTKGEFSREVHHLWNSTDTRNDDENLIVEDGSASITIGNGSLTINGNRVYSDGDDIQDERLQKLVDHPRKTFWNLVLWLFVNMILGSAVILLWLFASMALGQLSDRHRTLVSILAGIGFYILNQIMGVKVIISFVTDGKFQEPYNVFKSVVIGAPIYLVITAAVFSVICLVINHRKLNLA